MNVDRNLLDCSNLCFNKSINPKIDLNRNICVISCEESEFKYEYNNICYERCPENTSPSNNNEYLCLDSNSEGYYFDLEENIYKECYKTCKYCYGEGNETNDNCSECKPNYIFLNLSNDINCYNKCEHYYYFDEYNNYKCTEAKICPIEFNKLVKEKNKCVAECQNDDIYKYEYNCTCYENCPNNTYSLLNNTYICLDPTLEGYYLDLEENIFKECYETCKYCHGEGNITNNNCIECISNYTFLNESNHNNNCYINCSHYYFFNESNNSCTDNEICPKEYDKLIKEKGKCINKCEDDNIYKYEFNNTCYENCPNNTYLIFNNLYLCYNPTPDGYYLMYIKLYFFK